MAATAFRVEYIQFSKFAVSTEQLVLNNIFCTTGLILNKKYICVQSQLANLPEILHNVINQTNKNVIR